MLKGGLEYEEGSLNHVGLWGAVYACVPLRRAEETGQGWLAVAPKVGTLGIGGDAVVKLAPRVNARVGVNWLDLKLNRTMSDIDFAAHVNYLSYSALLDWHLFGGPFRVSGGALFNQNKASLGVTPTKKLKVAGQEYEPGVIGTLTTDLRYGQEIAPYVGIGWGNATRSGRFGLLVDLGVAYTDAPNVSPFSSTGTGMTSQDQIGRDFRKSLAQQRSDMQDTLDSVRFYPVIALSLFFRF